ncbi:hypothetical protein ACLOJK_036841 [Asimina triloba]
MGRRMKRVPFVKFMVPNQNFKIDSDFSASIVIVFSLALVRECTPSPTTATPAAVAGHVGIRRDTIPILSIEIEEQHLIRTANGESHQVPAVDAVESPPVFHGGELLVELPRHAPHLYNCRGGDPFNCHPSCLLLLFCRRREVRHITCTENVLMLPIGGPPCLSIPLSLSRSSYCRHQRMSRVLQSWLSVRSHPWSSAPWNSSGTLAAELLTWFCGRVVDMVAACAPPLQSDCSSDSSRHTVRSNRRRLLAQGGVAEYDQKRAKAEPQEMRFGGGRSGGKAEFCVQCFPLFQALGRHRASYKRPKETGEENETGEMLQLQQQQQQPFVSVG